MEAGGSMPDDFSHKAADVCSLSVCLSAGLSSWPVMVCSKCFLQMKL